MKAIVVRQPWATLIALGVKTIETRPSPPNGPMRPDGVRGLPGCTLERGERIAIVAGAQAPRFGLTLGSDFMVDQWVGRRRSPLGDYCLSCTDDGWSMVDLSLGAVVATVAVEKALRVVAQAMGSDGEVLCLGLDYEDYSEEDGIPTLVEGDNHLRHWWWRTPDGPYGPQGIDCRLLDDQLPLGDFQPGRWGWLLTDPQPCQPIPCKGRQGVFTLPDDITEALAPVRATQPKEATNGR